MYKLKMYFNTVKDDYEQGELNEYGTSWEEVKEYELLDDVKEFIRNNTYSAYDYIEYDEYNDFYRTAYTATDDNNGEMSASEHEQWKQGKINGWTVDIDIIIEEYTPQRLNNVDFKIKLEKENK